MPPLIPIQEIDTGIARGLGTPAGLPQGAVGVVSYGGDQRRLPTGTTSAVARVNGATEVLLSLGRH